MSEANAGDRFRELEDRVSALEGILANNPVLSGLQKSAKDSPATGPVDRSRAIIDMVLNGKSFMAGQYGDDRVEMDFTLTLATDSRPTRAVKGQLVFSDLFGDPGFVIGYTVNESLVPGIPFTAEGVGFDFNQFMSDHNWMLNTNVQDMLAHFEVRSIIFQDGTTETF